MPLRLLSLNTEGTKHFSTKDYISERYSKFLGLKKFYRMHKRIPVFGINMPTANLWKISPEG